MMQRLWALMLVTLRDAMRSQVFVNLALFAVAAVGGAQVLEQLSVGSQGGRVLLDLGLASLSVINALIVTFVTVRSMGGEENRHTLRTVLVRPVRRAEVLIGKLAGLSALVAANTVGAAVLLHVAGWWNGYQLAADLAWSCLGLLAEGMLVGAVTLLFTTFAGSAVAAMLGLGTYIAGLFAGELRNFAMAEQTALGGLVNVFYYAVPNLQRLDFHAQPPTVEVALGSLLYAACYAAAALALASAIFERRDVR